MNDAEKFIEQEIPLTYRCALPRALKTAYDAVELTIGETPFLQVPTARMVARGYLLSFAVDYALQGLMDKGEWPFKYEYDFFARPTGKHLKILTPNAVVTVSQLQHGDLQPRSAEFRRNYSLSNQTLFGFEAEELERTIGTNGQKHLILGHGYQELDFIQIGVPNPDGVGYLARTRNILTEIHDATPDVAPVEQVEAGEVVTLKEKLQRKLANGA